MSINPLLVHRKFKVVIWNRSGKCIHMGWFKGIYGNPYSKGSGMFIHRQHIWGAIHSTKISGNFGPKLSGSVRSNRKSFEKTGPPFEVDHFSRSDRSEFWLNGSRPCILGCKLQLREVVKTTMQWMSWGPTLTRDSGAAQGTTHLMSLILHMKLATSDKPHWGNEILYFRLRLFKRWIALSSV